MALYKAKMWHINNYFPAWYLFIIIICSSIDLLSPATKYYCLLISCGSETDINPYYQKCVINILESSIGRLWSFSMRFCCVSCGKPATVGIVGVCHEIDRQGSKLLVSTAWSRKLPILPLGGAAIGSAGDLTIPWLFSGQQTLSQVSGVFATRRCILPNWYRTIPVESNS